MDSPDLLELLVAPLHEAKLPYLIVGSVASIHYGEPRYTADVDLAINLPIPRVAKLQEIFPEPDFYCPPLEVLTVEVQRQERAHFNVIHVPSGLKADFYPCRQQPYFQWAEANRRSLEVNGRSWWFAPPEYVILWKLIFFREGHSEKHLRDIYSMRMVQGDRLDHAILEQFVTELSLEKVWQEALNF